MQGVNLASEQIICLAGQKWLCKVKAAMGSAKGSMWQVRDPGQARFVHTLN
jgi:hypothetical protein